MLTFDQAFRKFKSRLELNDKEQANASERHQEIRGHIRSRFAVESDFLTGSYARWTKTKPLKDVDIFCVLGEKEYHYRNESPSVVLSDFEDALTEEYGPACVKAQRRSVTVDFGVTVDAEDRTDYRIVSVDVVPAFADGENYEIPDTATVDGWTKTNPKIHAEKAVAANQAYNSEWKGLVRMAKYWNNHHDKPIKPSFLIEVMALECLPPPFSGLFDREAQSLFATLANRIHDTWEDPAGLGPPVSDMMDDAKKAAARAALLTAEKEAAYAIHLARSGRTGDALKAWRALFGPLFPLS